MALPIARGLFSPGQKVAVAVSAGADSVALLRALHAGRDEMGLVLSVVHVHHGLRGREADEDLAFVEGMAHGLDLPLRVFHGDVHARAANEGETVEEAARAVRYGFFREMLAAGEANSVATAHTLDDQAETVLMKLIRGAWTEGLGGIHPVVVCPGGRVVRPMLAVDRRSVETYLNGLGQPWREDASNADPAFTRNRVRAQLLPLLREFNPGIARQLARMSAVARAEEAWWQDEMSRVLPGLLLPGKPVRGGGRAAGASAEAAAAVGLEVARLRAVDVAVRRRVLRAALQQLGAEGIGFDVIEELLTLAGAGEAGEPAGGGGAEGRGARRLTLPGGVVAERTPRELRMTRQAERGGEREWPVYELSVPGTCEAPEYSLRVVLTPEQGRIPQDQAAGLQLRAWQAGDRVHLRYSRGPKKVAEVLDRLRVYGPDRCGWPVIVCGRRVLWMRRAEIDPAELAGMGLQIETNDWEPESDGYPMAGHR